MRRRKRAEEGILVRRVRRGYKKDQKREGIRG